MDALNQLEKKLRFSRTSNRETHYNERCRYKILHGCTITHTNLKNVTILIRVCKCGYYADKSDMKKKKIFKLDEIMDGIEVHTSSRCHYVVDVRHWCFSTSFEFRKIDYCPSEQKSTSR